MCIDLFTIGRFTVHGYGLMIGIGFAVAVLSACYRAKKIGLNPDDVSNIAIFVLIFGFLGGKMLFCIVEFDRFMQDPLSLLGTSGFVVYGGIITGIMSIVVYCRKKKINFVDHMDLLVPSIAINQGFGRIGCFMAGCCYGRQTTSRFGVVFPNGCLAPAGVRLIPTQLIMSAFDFLLAFFLIYITKKVKYRGQIALLYLGLYAVGRFIVEYLRNDDRGNVGVFSTSQFIAIIMIICVAVLYYFVVCKIKAPATVRFGRLDNESKCNIDNSASE